MSTFQNYFKYIPKTHFIKPCDIIKIENNSFYHSLIFRHLGYFTMLSKISHKYIDECPNFWSQKHTVYQIGAPWACLGSEKAVTKAAVREETGPSEA